MRFSQALVALALGPSFILAGGIRGFNSGTQDVITGGYKTEREYLEEFTLANELKELPAKFNSVRLYTLVDDSKPNSTAVKPNPAVKAAMKTGTTMLLGIWCSHLTELHRELEALRQLMEYGPEFARLVVGISVGNEELLRSSKGESGQPVGEVVRFVKQVRERLRGTILGDKPIGHAEPYKMYENPDSAELIAHLDFLGVNLHPFYRTAPSNQTLTAEYDLAIQKVERVAGGKPVWITESGWPVRGETYTPGGPAASVENAAKYWQEVGCGRLFNSDRNVWWYILRDSNPAINNRFAIADRCTGVPVFPLACGATFGQRPADTPRDFCQNGGGPVNPPPVYTSAKASAVPSPIYSIPANASVSAPVSVPVSSPESAPAAQPTIPGNNSIPAEPKSMVTVYSGTVVVTATRSRSSAPQETVFMTSVVAGKTPKRA
ncbi:putative glucan endo-1,3-beta-glucosidase eglC [Colletotrichum trifolii]|uniref:Putative glucan endo-1,3-beta-glucosidase eglC n=1 Tax=Colletotrichum trifolii TaxID=5466 RepID=A0A4R8QCI0_COLTR|nr:putative glucan endo-1,3-beta-glucosidase eglC [Colletotrichum trifolii]